MAKVVDIEQAKIQRLAAELLPAVRDAFADTGMLVVPTDGLDVEVWRMAARRAGHQVAKNVRTGITPDGSAVWIVDDSPLEGEHLAEVRRRAARTIEQLPRLR